jgi:hypothetical protein
MWLSKGGGGAFVCLFSLFPKREANLVHGLTYARACACAPSRSHVPRTSSSAHSDHMCDAPSVSFTVLYLVVDNCRMACATLVGLRTARAASYVADNALHLIAPRFVLGMATTAFTGRPAEGATDTA